MCFYLVIFWSSSPLPPPPSSWVFLVLQGLLYWVFVLMRKNFKLDESGQQIWKELGEGKSMIKTYLKIILNNKYNKNKKI